MYDAGRERARHIKGTLQCHFESVNDNVLKAKFGLMVHGILDFEVWEALSIYQFRRFFSISTDSIAV
jgi:hypothetical protein